MNTAQRGTEQQSRAARLQAAVILTVLLLAISCAAGHSYLVSSFSFSGNNPGIQRDASVAEKTRRKGARALAAVNTPRSMSAETMRRACRSLAPTTPAA